LLLAVILTATLALACSSFFRTTVGAFIWSYILTLGLLFGPALGWLLVYSLTGFEAWNISRRLGWPAEYGELLMLPLFTPAVFFEFGPGGAFGNVWLLITHSLLVLGASSVCLLLARAFVVRRAFAPPGNVVLSVFKRLDKIFLRLNDNPLTRGRTFISNTAALPEDEPVAWRETAKRSLGKAQYLLRVFIAIELPVAAICVMAIFASLNAGPLQMLLLPVGVVSVLIVSAHSASLIAGERSHQTLDVLRTTPMLGRDIIRQKFRSVQRLMLVLLVPFLTVFFFECSMRWRMPSPYAYAMPGSRREFDLPLYLTCSLLTVGVYLPMFAWLSLYIGLRVKTQTRAIVGSLIAILAWCVAPLLFVAMPLGIMFHPARDGGFGFVFLLSPASIMAFNEEGHWGEFGNRAWLAVILNFAAYGLILAWLRKKCYQHADRLLGCLDSEESTAVRPGNAEILQNSEINVCLSER
jgi:hypothetical protein